MKTHFLAVVHSKINYSFRCVHNHHKEKINKPFLLSFKGKMLNTIVKVNMVLHVLLVAVATVLVK
jgi:hypothetical protein